MLTWDVGKYGKGLLTAELDFAQTARRNKTFCIGNFLMNTVFICFILYIISQKLFGFRR
jgi:hypothetical protein